MATESYRSADDTAMLWAGKGYVPSLNRCISELGREKVEAMLKMYLIRLNVTTNASRPLSEGALEAMVPVILRHVTDDLDVTINLADLHIIFDRAMSGYYGKAYGGFTCQDICGWFDTYNREKMDAIDRIEQRRKADELGGFRGHRTSTARGEVARMRDAMHQYNLEQMKQELNKQQDHEQDQ